jgi:hypothetical protein
MHTTRAAAFGFLVVLVFAPVSAYAQGGGSTSSLLARIQALEAALAAETTARQGADNTLQNNINSESGQSRGF